MSSTEDLCEVKNCETDNFGVFREALRDNSEDHQDNSEDHQDSSEVHSEESTKNEDLEEDDLKAFAPCNFYSLVCPRPRTPEEAMRYLQSLSLLNEDEAEIRPTKRSKTFSSKTLDEARSALEWSVEQQWSVMQQLHKLLNDPVWVEFRGPIKERLERIVLSYGDAYSSWSMSMTLFKER